MNRRRFIATTGLAAGILSPLSKSFAELPISESLSSGGMKISVFSKNLQWLDYQGMAQTAASIGFDGVDLTVRPGGHVLPERVKEDLPKAVEAIRRNKLEVYSIVTSIEDATAQSSIDILETAKQLGIVHYRLGWFHYDAGKSIEENLRVITGKMKALDVLNRRLGVQGSYQNHEGHYFGGPIWDLAQVLKSIGATHTGSQYDVYHASIEGAHSWIYGFELLTPFIKTINIKDYQWAKKNGKWVTESVPLGEGVINFDDYFARLKKANINVPVSLHLEYPLGGADQGAKTLTVPKEQVIDAMKKDLGFLRSKLG